MSTRVRSPSWLLACVVLGLGACGSSSDSASGSEVATERDRPPETETNPWCEALASGIFLSNPPADVVTDPEIGDPDGVAYATAMGYLLYQADEGERVPGEIEDDYATFADELRRLTNVNEDNDRLGEPASDQAVRAAEAVEEYLAPCRQ